MEGINYLFVHVPKAFYISINIFLPRIPFCLILTVLITSVCSFAFLIALLRSSSCTMNFTLKSIQFGGFGIVTESHGHHHHLMHHRREKPISIHFPTPTASNRLFYLYGFTCSGHSLYLDPHSVWPFVTGFSCSAECFGGFIHPAVCISASFLFIADIISLRGRNTVCLSIRKLMDIWAVFYILALMNNATINLHVQVSVWAYVFISQSGIVESCDNAV